MKRLLPVVLVLLLATLARAQSGPDAAARNGPTRGGPAFELAVRAPDPLRELLEAHLELRRYREVSDLDDAEIARLVTIAERDVREIVATQGYFAPQVRIRREAGTPPLLVVEVEPGPATTVADVRIAFQGDIASSTDTDAVAQRDTIVEGWLLPRGQRFIQGRWDAAKAQSMRTLIARRYPAARIADSLADIDAATSRAILDLSLDSGPLFLLGPLRVTGLERYDPVLIPRLTRLSPGSVYDQDRIVQAQLRLVSSGYFDSAFIYVDPEGDPRAAPVQVTVREAPLQRLVLGLGVTTDSGLRASVEHTHNRVPFIGWRAATKLQAERKNPFAQSEWTALPDEDGWRWGVLGRIERLDDDRLVTHGQRLRIGRLQSGDHIDRNVYAQYERATVQNPRNVPLTPLDTGAGSAVSGNYVWTGRYFDHPTNASSGWGAALELGGGLTLAGNNKLFQRTVVRGLRYQPLERGRVQWRGEAGAVIAPESAKVPATQLFRTGGDTTVRGYPYRDIGVPLPGGLVGPGRYLAVGSVEWQRPIARRGTPTAFESTLFLDAGAVADKVGDLRPRVGVGAGVRWRSPVGPVEASLAYGVKARKIRLHFTAGFVF